MHGLGNDFVVVDNQSLEFRLTKPSVQKIADRRRGIGFDQLLTIEPARRNGDLFLDIKHERLSFRKYSPPDIHLCEYGKSTRRSVQ